MTRPSRDVLLVIALLAPVAFLSMLGGLNVLAGDPYPHLSAAGWLGLGLVPLGILLFVNPGRPRVVTLGALVGLGAFAAAEYFLRDLADPFEARRALFFWIFAAVGLGTGSALGAEGRKALSEALVVITLVLMVGALSERGFAGVLGNSGATSQAALPGAILGAWFAIARRGWVGWLGALAALLFGVHAVLTPVYASVLAFVLGLGVLFLSSDVRARTGRLRTLGIICALPLVGLILVRALPSSTDLTASTADVEVADDASEAAGDTGGFGVRGRLWASLMGNSGDRPLLGFGPGQFQAEYPVLRDPREIELSRHGVCLGGLSEVAHAHSEPLQVSAELGRLAGLIFAVLMAVLAITAFRRGVRGNKDGTRGLGAATIGVLIAASLNASWSFVPISALMSFALFGALFGRSDNPRIGRVLLRAVCVCLFLALPWAWTFAQHGRGFRAVLQAGTANDGASYGPALAQLLEHAPDSFPALAEEARRTALGQSAVTWDALLQRRPHSVELHERAGLQLLKEGQVASAAEAWDRAIALSPTHPRLLRNRIRLGWEQGDPNAADAYFETLQSNGCVTDEWLRERGTDCLLKGRIETGLSILERLESEQNLHVPEILSDRAREASDQGAARVGEALRAAANVLFAREHAATRAFQVAVRNYRQAVLATGAGAGVKAVPILVEQACAEWLADRTDDALKHTRGLVVDERTLRDLPDWARPVWAEIDAVREH